MEEGEGQVNGIPGMPTMSAAAMKKKPKRKRKLERGYAHLLEDVMGGNSLQTRTGRLHVGRSHPSWRR